ncbi:MAG: YEATS-associated helix-containing protein [Saprospiraceae bacterium]
MAHLWTLIGIIAGTGLLGGIANYLMNRPEGSRRWDWFEYFKSMALGLSAAATAPLFLNILSSNLMAESEKNPLLYFVFAGFCLVAAIFSSRFLTSIGDRVLRELEHVKRENEALAETAEMIVMQQSDDRQTPMPGFESASRHTRAPNSDDADVFESVAQKPNERDRLLAAFGRAPHMFRTVAKLAEETGLSEHIVRDLLRQLADEGLLRSIIRRTDGVECWMLA